uniref:Uncharacterized protein n=1 Tax=Parascaris univalens TaxID=6257 RepID=A0A915AA20_PARUN
MEWSEEFLSIKYTLRLKREVDTTIFSTSSKRRSPNSSKLESFHDWRKLSKENVQQQQNSTQQSQSEVKTGTLSSSTPSTFPTSSIVSSSFPESISSSHYGSDGDICAQLLKETDEFIKRIAKRYGTSNHSPTFATPKRCPTRKAESIDSTSFPETLEKQTSTRKTNSKNRQEKDEKVWSSGVDSSLQSSEINKSDLAQNINESSSDTSTPLDWMSPPSPSSQTLSINKEILIRKAAEGNIINGEQTKIQSAQRSCDKYNRHTRKKSYLSMNVERNDDENEKRFHSPVAEVMPAQRQSSRANRNIQMRKFIAHSTTTPQTCLAKLEKQIANARNHNGQISTPNRVESILTNRSLKMHTSPSSNITTAKRRSSKQQRTSKMNKNSEIIQNQQHDDQDRAALRGKIKTDATQSIQYPTTEIPITERKIPIPKLERNMLQRSARLPTGRELTMSTQGTSAGGTSNKSFSSPNSTEKSSGRDRDRLHKPKKKQKNTVKSTPFSRTSSSSGQSSSIDGSSSVSFSSSMTTTTTSDSSSISSYIDMREAKGLSKEVSTAKVITPNQKGSKKV